MATPKWNDERTATLEETVGSVVPVTQAVVAKAAEVLETSARSVASKLRKMGYEVESATAATTAKYSQEQEAALRAFIEDNSGEYTYAQIAEAFADGSFSAKSIQGKILSMELTSHVKPTPKVESVKTYTDGEEATFVKMASNGSSVEDIADALGKTVNSVRGKALSLLRSGSIDSIPKTANKAPEKEDPINALEDIASMTVEDIAETIGKSVRGVKTMLTRRGLVAKNYDGAAKAAKAAESAE